MSAGTILTGHGLHKVYGGGVRAVDGVDFRVEAGGTLAVVGESGCGKSTLARLIAMIEAPTAGTIDIAGETLVPGDKKQLKRLRPKIQIVFQDPYGSLNPRWKIARTLEEPLILNTTLQASERREKVSEMMRAVGLRPEHVERYPHMFSGGQRQRIAIARAMMTNPDILILDEPVSALDVSVQAQILNLLNDLQDAHDLTYVFISHDLAVVRHIADTVMVMYLGRVVEVAARDVLFANPQHPYTQALLSATPVPDPEREKTRIVLSGETPSPLDPPAGCTLHPRCGQAMAMCRERVPALRPSGQASVACHLYNDVADA